eukprot:TRINITY_DN14179_c0_g1_i1.p1 TRINITY_DN14179_c0_g1~~TRINITY_DN14179_c0_g1_i1.p1  ORF type:complete len:288 (-),score=54.13 TRINITY_DN14179_c0_g1_i1:564-1427(-)
MAMKTRAANGEMKNIWNHRSRSLLGPCLLAGVAALQIVWLLSTQLAQVPVPADPLPVLAESSRLADFLQSHSWVAGLGVSFGSYLLCALQKDVKRISAPSNETRLELRRVVGVTAWLAMMSGIVCAAAFFDMRMTLSENNGKTLHSGCFVGLDGTRILALVGSFMAGAVALGANPIDAEGPYAGRFSPALLGSAFAIVGAFLVKYIGGSSFVTWQLLTFSQGILHGLKMSCASMQVSSLTSCIIDLWIPVGAFALGCFATSTLKEDLGMKMLLVSAAGTHLMGLGLH